MTYNSGKKPSGQMHKKGGGSGQAVHPPRVSGAEGTHDKSRGQSGATGKASRS